MSEHHHDHRHVAVAEDHVADARGDHHHTGHGAAGAAGASGGHGGHGDHAAAFRDRFWWSLALAVPVVVCSEMFAQLLGYSVPPALGWVAPVLGSVLYLYGGWPFLTGAVSELRARRPGMMLLVALAITVAFVASALTTLHIGGLDLDFWWELALLIVIMLLGHWLEMRALGQASSALDALAALLPDEAERLDANGSPQPVALADLVSGDVVLVRSGGRVPADGTIVDGRAHLDESMLTGESRAVVREAGGAVVAGTVVTDSSIRVRVDAIGEDTALAGIRRLVEQAQQSRSRAQALADRAAAALFYFASAAAVVTFVAWLAAGDLQQGVERTITVLVIACPHALGLAIPLVIAISTASAARAGILIKDRLALERMRRVDVVLFDKTGTLTKGEPAVVDLVAVPDDGDRLLLLAGAAEADSEHPLAAAVVAAAADRGVVPAATEFRSRPGLGVAARGRRARGERRWAEHRRVDPGTGCRPAGCRPLEPGWQHGRLRDRRRRRRRCARARRRDQTDVPQAVADLHARGVRVAMITGDARPVADSVGGQLDIDEVFAEVRPADKDSKVAELQRRGHRVAMVGDGVNDAPALARADVGIAIGAGTDVAIESAGVVLAADDPRLVESVRRLSDASYRKMQQNLGWAVGYNVISVPLAAGVLAPIGFVLAPAIGAILMSVSTLVVALNAQLLRRLRLLPADPAANS